MKEYGGYFGIELASGKEYYQYDNRCMQRYNLARSAIIAAAHDGNYRKIWLPIYTCESIKGALTKLGISYAEYHIDKQFQPVDASVAENEILLWTNYFGVFEMQWVREHILNVYSNVVLDNTQAFFAEPQLDFYNVYSCKKFFGVPDGAYLIHKNLKFQQPVEFKAMPSAAFLLKTIENGTNETYEEYQLHEKRLEKALLGGMSKLSLKILSSVRYDEVAMKRKRNYEYVDQCLREYNELHFTLDGQQVPMIYPLLIKSEKLRDYLVEHNVYVSQWWKWLIEYPMSNEFERYLSRYLLPLPIDQRYELDDLSEMVEIVKAGL